MTALPEKETWAWRTRRRFRLCSRVVAVVVALSALKLSMHWFGLEFLSLNTLFTSAIAAAVFIIGFLLSSVLADYKEADRMPADLRVALEAINDDAWTFMRATNVDRNEVQPTLVAIVDALHTALSRDAGRDLQPVLAHVDALTDRFAALESAGMAPNYMVRLRTQQDALRRCLFRIYHMQRIQFMPSVHVLVQSLVVAVVLLLLFLQTEGSPESALIFGAISYMFVYALYLVDTLEQPFHKGYSSFDDVSLFLLREFADKLRATDNASEHAI